MNNQQTEQPELTPAERVYVLVLNADGNVLVRQVHSIPRSWTMLRASLDGNEDPIMVARMELSALGYESTHWVYLGSFSNAEGRVIHFLFARDARRTSSLGAGTNGVQWVSLRDLRYALLDGRIGQIADATSIALTMYLMALHQRIETTASSPIYT